METGARFVRGGMLVASLLGLAVVINGCSAGADEKTASSGQDLMVINPCLFNDHPIACHTGPTDPDAGRACFAQNVPAPPGLDTLGCSDGVESFHGGPDAEYDFACPAGVTVPGFLDIAGAPEVPGSGDPEEELIFVAATSTATACVGAVDSGWELVAVVYKPLGIGTGGCRGQCL